MLFRIFMTHFTIYFIVYISFFVSLTLIKYYFPKNGLLTNVFDLSALTEKNTERVIEQLNEKNLGINFLQNKRTLTPEEKISFQSSGLIHLLAVSGGQIGPLCDFINTIFIYIIFYFLKKRYSPNNLLKLIFKIRSGISLVISFFICGIFQCSGALVRVVFITHIFSLTTKWKKIYNLFLNLRVKVNQTQINRIFILLLVSLLFGNIFDNYSFMLSAIGAHILEITVLIINLLFNSLRVSLFVFLFLKTIATLIFCSLFVSIILYPLCHNQIINSACANLLAAPIVTFLITPLSLILIFIPLQESYFQFLISLFDQCLGLLHFVSNSFENEHFNLKASSILLFSDVGKFYLVLLLIILFSISDFLKERNLIILKHIFKNKDL